MEQYLAALALSLTLPDICGKAEYPQERSTSNRYIKWLNDQMMDFDGLYKEKNSAGYPKRAYLEGKLVYSLRCSFLHAGDTQINLDELREKDNHLTSFSLEIRDKDDPLYLSSNTHTCLIEKETGEIIREYTVNIPYLCKIISGLAMEYYKNNTEKFEFKYNIKDLRRKK